MQTFISKYSLAAHIALLATSPLFLFPWFGDDATASVLLWFSFIGSAWYFLEPSRKNGEMLHDARRRVVSALLKDPLFWCFAVLAVLALLRIGNDGVAMSYDAASGKWSISGAKIAFLPSCVRGGGRLALAVIVALTIVAAVCRHALGKAARTSFLFMLSLFAGMAAILAAFACHFGWGTALMQAECQIPTSSFVGTAFGICLLAGTASLAGAFERGWNGMLLLYSFALGACATGLYFFAPVYVIAYFLLAFLLVFAVSLAHLGIVCDRTAAFKMVAAVIMACLVPAICCMWLTPKNIEAARLAPFTDEHFAFFSQNYWKTREICSAVAAKVWNASPWLGSGLGSFGIDMNYYAASGDWTVLPAAQSCAVNGWWHLLAERGLVGAISLALVVSVLVVSLARRAITCSAAMSFFPSVAAAVFSLLALVGQAFFDVTFLRADVALAAMAVFTIGASSMVAAPANGVSPEKADVKKTATGE